MNVNVISLTRGAPESSWSSFESVSALQVEMEFKNFGFCGEMKNLGAGTRTKSKLNPHHTGVEGKCAIITALPLTFGGCILTFKGSFLTFGGCILTFKDCILTFRSCILTFWGFILTSRSCILSFARCILTFRGSILAFGGSIPTFGGTVLTFGGSILTFKD